MNFDLYGSLRLSMDMTLETPDGNRFESLPVFRTREEYISARGDPRQWNSKSKRQKAQKVSKARRYIPLLAAYSAYSEQPFFSSHKAPSSTFDELQTRLELSDRRKQSIRTLGWDCIRPIGIAYTLKEREELEKLALKEEEPRQEARPFAVHDSQNEPIVQENVGPTQQRPDPPSITLEQAATPDMDVNLDQNIQEDETSYDYDDEFARIEPEHENEVNSHLRADYQERSERTVHQFIETSRIEEINHPYDVENNYNRSYNYSDDDPIGLGAPQGLTDIEAYDIGVNGPGIADLNASDVSPSFTRHRSQGLRSPYSANDLGCD